MVESGGLHQRYRTSTYEPSFGKARGHAALQHDGDWERPGTMAERDPDEYARIIMTSRSAKMQKWRRTSQVGVHFASSTLLTCSC